MSLLINRFREQVSKSKDFRLKAESDVEVSYPTMFLNFDFANGSLAVSKDPNGVQSNYYSVGIPDGTINMVIGRSGCGKTTFAIQAAANIVRGFKTSCIFEDNIEGGLQTGRRLTLTRFTPEELSDRMIIRNVGVTAENFYERIKIIHDLKTQNMEDFEYDTGRYDAQGNRIFKLEPTVYILDSLALLMPGNLTEEEQLSGSMSATAAAKTNASVFKRIVPILKAANIILFVINHVNTKVEINMFQKTKAQVSYLKSNETLPGGNTPIYLSNNLFKFEDNAKLSSEKEFGINGSIVDIIFVKARTARAGQVVTLLFDQNNGFDPDLSLYLMLKQNDKIKGAGAYLYIDGHPEHKFSQKKFKDVLYADIEFRNIFMQTCLELLESSVHKSTNSDDQEATRFDVSEAMTKLL